MLEVLLWRFAFRWWKWRGGDGASGPGRFFFCRSGRADVVRALPDWIPDCYGIPQQKENDMNEKTHSLPKAKIQRDALSWFFWTLPIGAAALCGWFLLHDFVFAGPTITIYFQQAEGLQQQNSMVKFRGINIGQVESLKLTDHGQCVAVRVKLEHFATDLVRQGSIFWIVRPQLKLGAISGLRTIVSGNYVTVQPGTGAPPTGPEYSNHLARG